MGTRVKRPSPAMIIAIIALFAALSGTAFAALGKNTVGTKQLKKNAVTAAKIKNNAVTTSKLKGSGVTAAKLANNSVTTDKIANGAVTGAKIQASSLGTVPNATNATNATNAQNLAGQQSFFVRLNPGQSQTVASNGSVSLVAECSSEGGNDRIRILGQTTLNGAVMDAEDDLTGPGGSGKFLEPDTLPDERVFLDRQGKAGEISVESEIDQGFLLGPDGRMLTLNSEGVALGLNYGGSVCLVAGVVNAVNG